jgi:hypothetical protein
MLLPKQMSFSNDFLFSSFIFKRKPTKDAARYKS